MWKEALPDQDGPGPRPPEERKTSAAEAGSPRTEGPADGKK